MSRQPKSGDVDGSRQQAIAELYGGQISHVLFKETILDLVPVDRMFRDPEYTRPTNPRKVQHIAGNWNPLLCLPLIGSLRNNSGRTAILDGGHRHQAAINRGDPPALPCLTFIDLTIEQEAALFRDLNQERTQPTPIDIFRASWRAGDAPAIAIRQACIAAGFDVAVDGQGSCRITSVPSLYEMYNRLGVRAIHAVLTIIRDAWGNDGQVRKVTHSWIMLGVFAFWLRYREARNFDQARLVRLLHTSDPEVVLGRSEQYRTKRTGLTPPMAVGKHLWVTYNTGLRGGQRLADWQDRVVPSPAVAQRAAEAKREAARRRKAKTVSA